MASNYFALHITWLLGQLESFSWHFQQRRSRQSRWLSVSRICFSLLIVTQCTSREHESIRSIITISLAEKMKFYNYGVCREEGEIGKSVEKIRQVFNERQRRCGWPTKLMLSPPTPNLQTRGRLAAIMFTMPRLADAGPEMRRDGKAKVFLASRLQLTLSSDWEQHSLSNFACGYKWRRRKF